MSLLCSLNIVMFSPRHNTNKRIALNVEHLVGGWLEKLVHLQLFQMAHKLPRHLVGILKKKKKEKSFECGTLDI